MGIQVGDGRVASITELQEVPSNSLILLVGPPGTGKSTFCRQTVLHNIDTRPVIHVTTESTPSKVEDSLRQKGLGKVLPHSLVFVDAFHETVGLPSAARSDTVDASSADLTSLGIAISKLRERVGENVLLVFDSLTSPYLMSGQEIIRFMRMTLLRLTAEGNAVLACVDEGCGKQEDLVAMMSTADGIIKMITEEDKRFLNVVKHPNLRPIRTEVPLELGQVEPKPAMMAIYSSPNYASAFQKFFESFAKGEAVLRCETGDFVNLFWPTLEHWSGMLWDPKRFPTMIYDMNREEGALAPKVVLELAPLRIKLMMKLMFSFQSVGLFLPKSFSKVKDMEKLLKSSFSQFLFPCHMEHSGIIEYIKDVSKTDEHYFRLYESADCWGFENVGTTIASHLPPEISGMFSFYDREKRYWNAIETRCIGLGDPYCEFKFVPDEIDELRASLEKDSVVVERIHDRLMGRLMGFLLQDQPLVERPKLGADVHLHVAFHAMGFPHVAGERYQMAQRMGGARTGKEVGERLLKAGITEDEAVKRILNLMDHCKVGKVSMGETIKMKENVESVLESFVFATERKEPCCYFTTGFLNGFFSVVKDQHIKETKCIGMGDPYCEWEFR
jgi:predicted hydrocarbon binding protein/KaiC/GvpD/RAD55 family RecA-like ATPase